MCVLFSISVCANCFTFLFPPVFSVVHSCTQVCYIIMAPIVAKRMYEEMDVNRANVEKLQNYKVINECADEYTNLDIDLIDS